MNNVNPPNNFLPVPFSLVLDTTQFQNVWYVYSVSNDERMLYLGVADARHMLTMHDGMVNSKIRQIITQQQFVRIDVYSSHRTQSEARMAAQPLISEKRPLGNQFGIAYQPKKKRVKCIETNEFFESVNDASQWLGVSASSMSNHLHRRPGCSHLRNHTFMFEVIEDRP